MNQADSTLVVCIGNELVADDAVGYHTYLRLIESKLPKQVRIDFCGVGGIALLDLLQDGDQKLIVVDAVQLGAPPGTIHRLAWEQLPPTHAGAISAHGIGLRDAISIGLKLYPEKMPSNVILFGIEGCCFDQLGGAMTEAVSASIPTVVDHILNELHSGITGGSP